MRCLQQFTILSMLLFLAPGNVESFSLLRPIPTASSVTSSTSLSVEKPAKRISGSAGTGVGWIDPSAPVNSDESLQKMVAKSMEGVQFQKRLSLLGSTGSIGTQTLEIVDACPDNFVVDALSAGTNVDLMMEQVLKYQPKIVSLSTAEAAAELKERLVASGKCTSMPEIVHGEEGILAVATVASADTVVTGIVGAAGLKPTIEAIKLGKDIALANKETLISGGPVINPLVEKYGVNMVRFIAVPNGSNIRALYLKRGIRTLSDSYCRFYLCHYLSVASRRQ
jgi:1-deoxy-D-xylulose-5-phosphate reductoisomerase